jgi:4-aminobutyrate aminotransferase
MALCDENGILLFSEEVQQGFGRTGKWFGIENFGVVPDAIILGKAIASGLPLGGCVAKAELMDDWEAPSHLFTAAGNPVCCAAAVATINVIRDENLLQHTTELGAHVKGRFEEMQKKYEAIGDVRGSGFRSAWTSSRTAIRRSAHREAAAKIA